MTTFLRPLASFVMSTALLALSANGAMAQSATEKPDEDTPLPLGTVLLLTTRIESTVLDNPSNTTVIEGDELEEDGISDMQELVRRMPGISVGRQTSSTDPFNTFGGFSIRGVGGNRVQIQVDGSRVAERIIDGTRDYLDFNFTKQVEVVRGPASVLWGADALGGIVAVETIDPEDVLQGRDRGGSVRTSYDSLDSGIGIALTFGQKLSPNVELLLALSREQNSEAKFSNARLNTATGAVWDCPRNLTYGATPCNELDPASKTSVRGLVKLVWTPSTDHKLEFSVDVLQRDTAVDHKTVLGPLASGDIITSYQRDLDLQRKRFAVEHSWTPEGSIFEDVKTTLAFTPHSYDRTGVRTLTNAAGETIRKWDALSFSEEFLELDVQATMKFDTGGAEHRVVFGFDGDRTRTHYSRKDITTNLTTGVSTEVRGGGFNFANATTTRADIYIQDTITFGGGKFELTPGLRYATYKIDPNPDADYKPVAGAFPTGRKDKRLLKSLGMMYHFDDNYSVWAKYGEGFKMPTAQQLYTSLPGAFFNLIPAPNLQPEEVKNFEIGVRGEFDRGFFAVNAFKAEYTNFVESFYNIPGTNKYTYRNIAVVDVWGIEASGAWEFNDVLTGNFSATWQDGKQKATPTAVATTKTLVPFTATVGLDLELPQYDLTLSAVGLFASSAQVSNPATKFKPGSYALLDLHAKWQVTENGAFNFGIQNVFDTRYFQAGASTYNLTQSARVERSNPIELQTGPGRVFTISYNMTF